MGEKCLSQLRISALWSKAKKKRELKYKTSCYLLQGSIDFRLSSSLKFPTL